MRNLPEDSSDREELERLEAPEWMIEQLKFNPSYTSWGPYEDYMSKQGDGFDCACMFESWASFGPWTLDAYNEVVNFYFEIGRPSTDCRECNGKGSHPDAQWVTESWYRHSSPFTLPDESEVRSKMVMESFGCDFKVGVNGRGQLPPEEVINRYGKPFLEHCVSTIDN